MNQPELARVDQSYSYVSPGDRPIYVAKITSDLLHRLNELGFQQTGDIHFELSSHTVPEIRDGKETFPAYGFWTLRGWVYYVTTGETSVVR